LATNPTATKRQKEKARQEKAQDKEARRLKRKEENALERERNAGEIPGVAEYLREQALAAERGDDEG
jgi:hypothetical protein